MSKRVYEIVLVVEANGRRAGNKAANAAWYAADGIDGCTVVSELARERRGDGSITDTGWSDWSEKTDMVVRIGHEGEP